MPDLSAAITITVAVAAVITAAVLLSLGHGQIGLDQPPQPWDRARQEVNTPRDIPESRPRSRSDVEWDRPVGERVGVTSAPAAHHDQIDRQG